MAHEGRLRFPSDHFNRGTFPSCEELEEQASTILAKTRRKQQLGIERTIQDVNAL